MKAVRGVLLWLPAALWYRVIWGFSAQTAAVSGDLSDRLLWRLMNGLSPSFAGAGEALQSAAVELLSYFERKAAHMFLYFVLALLVCLALSRPGKTVGRRMALTLAACAVLAGLDELHQRFVDGRSGQLKDVAIDLAGAGVAMVLLGVLGLTARRRGGPKTGPLALLPAVLCALLVVLIAAFPGDLTGLPPFAGAAERFIPGFADLDPGGRANLLASLSPILRELLYLACCALLGCGAMLAAALAGLPLLASVGLSLTACCLAGGGIAALSGLPSAAWGAGFAALGVLGAVALWLLCLAWAAWARRSR